MRLTISSLRYRFMCKLCRPALAAYATAVLPTLAHIGCCAALRRVLGVQSVQDGAGEMVIAWLFIPLLSTGALHFNKSKKYYQVREKSD